MHCNLIESVARQHICMSKLTGTNLNVINALKMYCIYVVFYSKFKLRTSLNTSFSVYL